MATTLFLAIVYSARSAELFLVRLNCFQSVSRKPIACRTSRVNQLWFFLRLHIKTFVKVFSKLFNSSHNFLQVAFGQSEVIIDDHSNRLTNWFSLRWSTTFTDDFLARNDCVLSRDSQGVVLWKTGTPWNSGQLDVVQSHMKLSYNLEPGQ